MYIVGWVRCPLERDEEMAEEITAPKWWINVPANIAKIPSKELSSTAKLVFGEIYSMLNAMDSFYMTNKPLGERIGVSERQASRSISKLKKLGIIIVKVVYKSNVPKRLIKINQGSPYLSNPPRQMCRTPHDRCGDIENNRENKKRQSTSEEDDQAKGVIDMLDKKANKSFRYGKNNMGYIKARIKEGYSSENFAYVIMNKVADWGNSDMDKFIRPKTLFTEQHMDDYLNEKQMFSSSSNQGRKSSAQKKHKTTEQVKDEREKEEMETERKLKEQLEGRNKNE